MKGNDEIFQSEACCKFGDLIKTNKKEEERIVYIYFTEILSHLKMNSSSSDVVNIVTEKENMIYEGAMVFYEARLRIF